MAKLEMKARLVRTFTIKVKDKGLRTFRLLTGGKHSDFYVDYYVLQSREDDELGGDRWNTEIVAAVSGDEAADSSILTLFRLLHGEGVTSTVPE